MDIEDSEKVLTRVEKYVKKNASQFTLEDAVSKTGLPVLETKIAIDDLMGKYDCKLRVTENGDLIYDFGTKLQRRHAKKWTDYFWEFMGILWRGFQVFYKILTSLFLVIYFVVFLVILIGLAVSSEDGDGIGDLIAVMLRVFISIFEWNTIMGYHNRYYRTDAYGYRYQHYKEKPRILGRKKKKPKDPRDEKGIVASIYDYIFGPPRVELDPLANSQEVASFLRKYKGLITTSEVQALAGWTREEAENFMTECLTYFDGEAKISDNATLYGDFSQLLRSKDDKKGAPIIWFWDEYEPEYELTGNSTTRNWIITLMNAFNIVMSSLVLSGSLLAGIGFLGVFFLGVFPLVYSTLFFLIPAIRWFRVRTKQKEQHKQNIRKRLMRVVFQTHSHEIPLSKLTEVTNKWRTTEELLDQAVVDDVMKDTILDLGGEGYVNEEGEIIYRFEKLGQELDDIDKLRKNKKDDSDIGDVVFET